MRIKDVCKVTDLTKKAINYYESKGIIAPSKDGQNNYREYSNEEIDILREVSLYRKLDLSIKEIKELLNASEEEKKLVFNHIIKERERKIVALKKQNEYFTLLKDKALSIETIESINKEIIEIENNQCEYILNELRRAFPSGLGTYLVAHFKPYLRVSIDTKEKQEAFLNIVQFFDELDEAKIPKLLKIQFALMGNEETIKMTHKRSMEEMNKILSGDTEKIEKLKKRMLKIAEDNEKSIPFYDILNKMKKSMFNFFEESGYYKIFIPNIKILSEEYANYNDMLHEVNNLICDEIGVGYDENMRIVKLK